MIKRILPKLAVLISILLLFGCSASYVSIPPEFSVQPVKEQAGYYSEDEKIEFLNTYIEFVQQEEDLFLFYIEVSNNSEDTIAVYPAEIYLEVVEELDEQNNVQAGRYFALNPAREIERINKQLREEDERHDGATVLNVVLGIFSTVADLASNYENKEEVVAVDILNTGMNQVDEEVYHSNAEKDLAEIKKFWLNDMLNESYINPGETVAGLVYLPYSVDAELFKIVIPVGGYPESTVFRQIRRN